MRLILSFNLSPSISVSAAELNINVLKKKKKHKIDSVERLIECLTTPTRVRSLTRLVCLLVHSFALYLAFVCPIQIILTSCRQFQALFTHTHINSAVYVLAFTRMCCLGVSVSSTSFVHSRTCSVGSAHSTMVSWANERARVCDARAPILLCHRKYHNDDFNW